MVTTVPGENGHGGVPRADQSLGPDYVTATIRPLLQTDHHVLGRPKTSSPKFLLIVMVCVKDTLFSVFLLVD